MMRVLLALCLLVACDRSRASEQRYRFALPRGVTAPVVPADNPMSPEKVELGRRLFWDRRLSSKGSYACASCHVPERAFSDGREVARGIDGEAHPRNTPSLANVGYFGLFTWANPRLHSLEGQALVPLLARRPPELGVADQLDEVLARLRADPDYARRFRAAFPDVDEPVTSANLIAALAAFERTLLSLSAPYDRYLAGDARALSPAALRGLALFESDRLKCSACHRGRLQSDAADGSRSSEFEPFHNTGLYNLGGRGLYPQDNQGLYAFTRRPQDMGKFRTPSLRNIAETAPYMHDGSIPTLDAVIDHYAAGGRAIASGPRAGIGADNPYKDARVSGFSLSAEERADLLAFLLSLTDDAFARNPAFSDPFAPARAAR